MVKQIKNKMQKTWAKLLKAWTKGKEEKAIKLQHKLLKQQLKAKKK